MFGLFKSKPKLVTVKRKAKAGKKVKKRAAIAKPKRKKAPAKKALSSAKRMPQVVGKITHYFAHVKAGVILVTKGTISIGDTLQIKGRTTKFKQKVNSMQINNVPIKKAKKGEEIGLLVKSRVRHNDIVYKL